VTDLSLKKKLENNELSIGSWISLAHPSIAEIMAQSGFDWLVVDLEHSVITIREAEEIIRIIDLSGVTPLVRLTSNNADQIKRIMDAGSHGIIVPMVNSADDARRAVAAVKYSPAGIRGYGLARAQGYGAKFKEYLDWEKEQTIVIVQIEHIEAVKNMQEILSVNGVDGFIVGPYDLTGSMGIPGDFTHPDYLTAMETIKRISEEMNVPGGIHIVEPEPDQLNLKIDEGYTFIAYSVDIRMLHSACITGLNSVRDKKQ